MSFESDWFFLRAALPDLQEYILSSELYWTLHSPRNIPGGVRLPQLTLGSLLLAEKRLTALPLADVQQAELEDSTRKIHHVRSEWRANWGLKAAHEFRSRLNLWRQYLGELRDEARTNAQSYPSQVRSRAILHLLPSEMIESVPADENDLLSILDQILRGISRSGPFVWEPEMASGFPEEDYWFLYVRFDLS